MYIYLIYYRIFFYMENTMVGFFVFDDVPSVDNQLVLAHASLNNGIQGLFFVRESDCKDISSV